MAKYTASIVLFNTIDYTSFTEDSVISYKFHEYDWNDLEYLLFSGIVKSFEVEGIDTSLDLKISPEYREVNYDEDKIRYRCDLNFGMKYMPKFVFTGGV